MPTITDMIMDAIEAGAPPKVARFLGKLYERAVDVDRNFKNMRPPEIKAEIEKIEAEMKRVKLYKGDPPFTLRERILACREQLAAAFKLLMKATQQKRS